MSLDTWKSPTAPLKSLGCPSVGSGKTFSSDAGLAIVTSFGAIPLYILCKNGQPNLAANAISSADCVLIFTLSGVSTDKEKSPGFTAASTLCQVMTTKGLPSMTLLAAFGLFREIVEREVTAIERGQAIQRRDDSRAYAHFDIDRHAFAHIYRACRNHQLDESRAAGFQLQRLSGSELAPPAAGCGELFVTVQGVRIGLIAGDHLESESSRFRRESGNGEDAQELRRDTDQDVRRQGVDLPLTNSRPCDRPSISNVSPGTVGNGTLFR